ncbi:ATP synthase F1, delta subunit [Elusimicrobium minutum Pei191]|uniref:ATP synthase subunit delta n=1 Tax=Elusimicrobium minutum (strain Pei191) TaxID=445932 RepID=ATPD_ELUMP|nr:ATP synthase F1 subunit delta [Elusimicrobium minutum]B2KEW9.1 RecName: Full=ATP synthase subunit delta; AltName: Full=ATP synthase F(1) sector subunit delta; AltName: Full=F-type ATPase subunit delta; Short=F-ATPase subunit delta [Elusimicrobium minutum Pei191]ACC99065.1 ATP synthase F1, delta subunit [Elusimicrobium minutum Pei191]
MKSTDRILAHKYSIALSSLADKKDLPSLLAELKEIHLAIGNSSFFYSPAVPKKEKKQALSSALKTDNFLIKNTLFLLIDNKKLNLLGQIIIDLNKTIESFTNTVSAEVYCAREMDDKQQNAVIESLKKYFKANFINADFKQDKTLISGLKIKTADYVIDGSTKNNLQKLKQVLQD